jgi:hypothetical protein
MSFDIIQPVELAVSNCMISWASDPSVPRPL